MNSKIIATIWVAVLLFLAKLLPLLRHVRLITTVNQLLPIRQTIIATIQAGTLP